MRIAVCDDEKIFRDILRRELERYAGERGLSFELHEFSGGSELLSCGLTFDLIFLDYKMDGKDGIDTAGELRRRSDNTAVIFVSSYREIVFESIKYKVFRFLLKPLEPEKLAEALDSLLAERQQLVSIIAKDEAGQKSVVIPAGDIIYAQADNIYATVVTARGSYRYPHSISRLEKELGGAPFFRSNRSFIVSFDHIASYDSREITLDNGHRALISRQKLKDFRQAYLTYLKIKTIG